MILLLLALHANGGGVQQMAIWGTPGVGGTAWPFLVQAGDLFSALSHLCVTQGARQAGDEAPVGIQMLPRLFRPTQDLRK